MITNVQLEEFRKILDFFNSEEKFDIDAYNKAIYLIQISPDRETRYEILKEVYEKIVN